MDIILSMIISGAVFYFTGLMHNRDAYYQSGFKDGKESVELEDAIVIVQEYQARLYKAHQIALTSSVSALRNPLDWHRE